MRIAIDCRWVNAGDGMLKRGTGRYVRQQLEAVLSLDATNEYYLLVTSLRDIEKFSYTGVRDKDNVRFIKVQDHTDYTPEKILWYQERFQRQIAALNPDMYHHPAPMAMPRNSHWGFDVCPSVVNLFDVIPSHYPEQYELGEFYERTLTYCSTATHLITLSEFSRQDIAQKLDYPIERITVAPPYADSQFIPSTVNNGTLTKFGITTPYFLNVGGMHYAKGLDILLKAYAALPENIRQTTTLVLAFAIDGFDRENLLRTAAKYDFNIVVTGYVEERELVDLYNGCVAYVHPSRIEGFGLPPLEAMQCGARVVCTHDSSLLEVCDDEAYYFLNENVRDLADTLGKVHGAAWLDKDLVIKQAATFNAERLGKATLTAYGHAHYLGPYTHPNRFPELVGMFDNPERARLFGIPVTEK
jgi:glycosyltransferase involved in cell wall biosynthesis